MSAFSSPFRPYGAFTAADAARLADALKVIADPARLRILGLLRRHGPTTVSDLVARTGMKQPNVSHHLKVLGQSGLIRTTDAGLREIDVDAVARLSRMIDPGDNGPAATTVDVAPQVAEVIA
ncbi:ArsR/SmtB family transcription factor [Actinoplanes palleronii]|uniref:HTH arsR-type domain-containing protein n=1 Tax=Actinoplanes palleronii TaxID=113570 RepID=A0ABQ4BJC2_9ACTN|nr:metalloregulator ArsR/SmtB family transcription factor [Actinoplanes palleronii]GIE70771.1 hypothetical protein Apa02nite_068790 [Actinoplanes palleronii]